jgi:hypothetical protein
MKIWRALLVALFLFPVAAWAQPSATGVILMHGKWGTPDKGIQPVELELRGAGFVVVSREMPWSERRAYDAGFDRAPRNPYSRFQNVDADHIGTPASARRIVLDWVKGLP